MKWRLILVVLLTINNNCKAQLLTLDSFYFDGATAYKRLQSTQKLQQQYIATLYTKPVDSITSSQWQKAFWAIGFMGDTRPATIKLLQAACKKFTTLSPYTQLKLLENIYALATVNFTNEVQLLIPKLASLKQALIVQAYLKKYKMQPKNMAQTILNFAKTDTALYAAYQYNLTAKNVTAKALKNLLSNNTVLNYTLIISLQPSSRNTEGIAIIKQANGQLLTAQNGKTFSSPQLARAVNNMPWYISNGNTPQGIFAINGLAVSDNSYIGKTPNLQLVMPGEVLAFEFFKLSDSTYINYNNADFYTKFPFLTTNSALWQTYYAAKAGRTEIIAHGTTVNPEYYKGAAFYPNTPTLGCLSSTELYDLKTGKCIKSNQLALVNAFNSFSSIEAYLVVIEADQSIINAYK